MAPLLAIPKQTLLYFYRSYPLGVVEVAPLLKCLAGEVKKRSAVYKQLAIDSRTVGKMLPLVVVWPRRLGIAPWQEELLKLMEWSILVMLPSVLEGVGRFDCRLGLVEKFQRFA